MTVGHSWFGLNWQKPRARWRLMALLPAACLLFATSALSADSVVLQRQLQQQTPLDLAKLSRELPARVRTQDDLRAKVAEFHEAFRERSNVPQAAARDAIAVRKRFDLLWAVNGAYQDSKVAPVDLTEFGFEKQGDRTFVINTKDHPEWSQAFLKLMPWQEPDKFEMFVPSLKQRGFRERDIAALRTYLSTHSWQRASIATQRPIVERMTVTVRDRRRKAVGISADELDAFNYQYTLALEEAQRLWVDGLFNVLDNQRQRILSSMFDEMSSQYHLSISNTDHDPKYMKLALDSFASGGFAEQLIQQEQALAEKEVQQ